MGCGETDSGQSYAALLVCAASQVSGSLPTGHALPMAQGRDQPYTY